MQVSNGELYWDIRELIADCRECTKDDCPEWCDEFVRQQVYEIIRKAEDPEYRNGTCAFKGHVSKRKPRFIDTYQVEYMDGRKIIHYNSFTWERDDDRLPYAVTKGCWCYVEIGEDNYKRALEKFDLVKQYQYDMTLEELLEYEAKWKCEEHLHMDEVTQDTPCGLYWHEWI